MPLTPGTKLGPYEILAPLGAGGMGEVYRGRDTRLNRTVAVKVLSGQFSFNSDFRQRFEREAKAISALQHPHICTLYDIGNQDGIEYLVLEFVEGETLDQRLRKGPLPIDQVLRYSAEIASALHKAHRQGITHRDLKPANIMLTKSGTKLLDFGLAKQESGSSALASALTDVTVADQKLTAQGMLVGTFQYMAPEQLEGREADARSDIFALGAVIHEMASGHAAFSGRSRASLIASILSTEPPPISSVQPMSPPALHRVVKRCLSKDPEDRWQNAGDLASELRWIAEGGSQAGVPAPLITRHKNASWISWAAAGMLALAGVILSILYFKNSHELLPSVQSYLPPPDSTLYFFSGDSSGFPIISPQGDRVAFVATDTHGIRLLWIRSLSDGSVRSLPGTDAAALPFWSGDGKSIGYFSGGKVKRISPNGGPSVDVADADNARGGSWSREDVILFTPTTQAGIFSVPASGGTPKQVTTIDKSRHTTHRWPYFLPDGKHFLYLAANHAKPHAEFDEIYFASLDGKENRRLTASTSNGIAVPGYLLFLQGSVLVAQPFDDSAGTLTGEPAPLAQNVHFEEGNWRGVFDCSGDGTLIYQSMAGIQGSQLLWYGHDGKVLGKLSKDVDHFSELRLSPDGKRLAASVGDPNASIWVYDLERNLQTRYTFSGNTNRGPIWSPDSSRIMFSRDLPNGASDLMIMGSDSAGTEQPLFSSNTLKRATSWSPDGKYVIFTETPVGQGIYVLTTSGDIHEQEFLPKILNASNGQFSPDGQWVAYSTQESGIPEVFVTRFPGPRGKWQVSIHGGGQPLWRHDGKALFYWSADHTIMEAQIETKSGQFQVTASHALFKVDMPSTTFGSPTYDVSHDGQRFIVNSANSVAEQPLTVITNWTSRLHQK